MRHDVCRPGGSVSFHHAHSEAFWPFRESLELMVGYRWHLVGSTDCIKYQHQSLFVLSTGLSYLTVHGPFSGFGFWALPG